MYGYCKQTVTRHPAGLTRNPLCCIKGLRLSSEWRLNYTVHGINLWKTYGTVETGHATVSSRPYYVRASRATPLLHNTHNPHIHAERIPSGMDFPAKK
ncbi:MAG: hypothetical protein LBL33_07200 [Tannerella sp.]|nr:hypothetical protein [Tannerella sp.]